MVFSKNLQYIVLYGLTLSVLVFALKWMEWKFLIADNAMEIYIGLIAVFFTALGIWIASQIIKPKIQTIVIEKPTQTQINQSELDKLNLSTREYEVLQLLSKGYSNADIAEHLFLSVSTVKTHVSNLFFKMGVKSRTQTIEMAKRLHIIA